MSFSTSVLQRWRQVLAKCSSSSVMLWGAGCGGQSIGCLHWVKGLYMGVLWQLETLEPRLSDETDSPGSLKKARTTTQQLQACQDVPFKERTTGGLCGTTLTENKLNPWKDDFIFEIPLVAPVSIMLLLYTRRVELKKANTCFLWQWLHWGGHLEESVTMRPVSSLQLGKR